MPTVTLRYFASLRETVGRSSQQIDLQGEESAAAVFRRATGLALPAEILVAVNQTYAAAEKQIREGDEVAFFPPVTGG